MHANKLKSDFPLETLFGTFWGLWVQALVAFQQKRHRKRRPAKTGVAVAANLSKAFCRLPKMNRLVRSVFIEAYIQVRRTMLLIAYHLILSRLM
jgi:hypothetical protein